MVGTAKAKDLILGWAQEGGRIRLAGAGAGRMHWYEGVRDDFYEQMLSEIKIPSRLNPRKRVWKARTDRRNEALDCTVYALYLSRHLRLHLRRPGQWDLDEMRLRQGDLIAPANATVTPENSPKSESPEKPDEAVQTSEPMTSDDDSPQTSPQDDAAELIAAQRAKQAWANMLAQRKGAMRGR